MLSDKLLFRHSNSLVKDGIKLLCLGMLKLFYYKNQFSNLKKKIHFWIIKFPCITITTGVQNFMQVKMHKTCVVGIQNEYIHVCTLKG